MSETHYWEQENTYIIISYTNVKQTEEVYGVSDIEIQTQKEARRAISDNILLHKRLEVCQTQ